MNNINILRSWATDATRPWPSLGRLSLALVGLLWLGAFVSRADTHYVATNALSISPYTSWTDAASNIQWAVDNADIGETVLVSNGTYNLTNQINILTNITVRSVHGPNVTIINGDNYTGKAVTNRCFYMTNGVLDGFTVSNGYSTGADYGGGGICITNAGSVYNCFIYRNYSTNNNGAGIFIHNASGSIISNCTVHSNIAYNSAGGVNVINGGLITASRISGNRAYNIGGVLAYNGCIISNCTVDGNRAELNSGGVYIQDGPAGIRPCLVVDCVISNNSSPHNSDSSTGGGVTICNSTIRNSIIIGNSANAAGGVGIIWGGLMSNCQVIANSVSPWYAGFVSCAGGVAVRVNDAPADIINCVIANNVSNTNGAGLYISGSVGAFSAVIKNCLIYGNTNQTDKGGAVYSIHSGTATGTNRFINCTIVSNQARTLGGGVYLANSTNNDIKNCIIYANVTTADDYDEVYPTTTEYITDYWYTCASIALANNQGNTTNNPLFMAAVNRNYRLSANSPCINTGTNQSWMTGALDLDGRTRIRYGRVDIGAYETIYNGTFFVVP